MGDLISVVIGIQARSTSARLPGKSLEMIGGKPMIKHVIDACESSMRYMNRYQLRTKVVTNAVVLIPQGDDLGPVLRRYSIRVIEGPESDVLARYHLMAEKTDPDYIVRITADCPDTQAALITKHIKTTVVNAYDYCSNVDEEVRMAPDGLDVEVFSRQLLNYAFENAKEKYDREHVTPFMRREPPSWARIGIVLPHVDQSHLKLSVDTQEELDVARERDARREAKITRAIEKYGKENVHRF